MKRVLFICLGNICRSPLAEFLLKDIVKQKGEESEWIIESRGTSDEEEGSFIYPLIRPYLDGKNIDYKNKRAKKISKEEYGKFDCIIGMERKNLIDAKRVFGEDEDNKLCLLLSFCGEEKDVADPWWTRDFDTAYKEILRGVNGVYKKLSEKKQS